MEQLLRLGAREATLSSAIKKVMHAEEAMEAGSIAGTAPSSMATGSDRGFISKLKRHLLSHANFGEIKQFK